MADQVLITTVPFGALDRRPLQSLESAGVPYLINALGRRLKQEELADMIGDASVPIAGTEPITKRVMDRAHNLRLITRVGIGLDNVDLAAARERGILVAYTPDAPSPAVAELTVGLMLALARSILHADRGIRNGSWHRFMGRRIGEMTVGIIGVGRVGKRVVRLLTGFGCPLLAHDIAPELDFGGAHGVEWMVKDGLYRASDIITVHLPLTPSTRNLITRYEMETMRRGAFIVNMSRGGIVNEHDLADVRRDGHLDGAAIDVFQQEPYSGELAALERCILTCHMGSMSEDCRARMELEAVEDAVRFLNGQPLSQLVPETEYALQRGD